MGTTLISSALTGVKGEQAAWRVPLILKEFELPSHLRKGMF
jgi:hypothetical protein